MANVLEVDSLPQNVSVKECFGGYLTKRLILQNAMNLMESPGNLGSGLTPNTRFSYIGVFVIQSSTQHNALSSCSTASYI